MVRSAAIAAAVVMSHAPLLAAPSTAGDDPPLRSKGLISTPVVNGRSWQLGANVNTTYDSNFRRSNDPESAVRVSGLISAAVGYPVGRQQLFLGGGIGRDAYLGKDGFNRNRYQIGGGVAWRLGVICSGNLAGEYSHRQNQTSDLAQFVDNVQQTKVFGASADCQTAGRLGFGGSVRRVVTDNDRVERQTFDLRTTSYSPQISYGTPALGQFSAGGSLTSTNYPNRLLPTPSGFAEDRVKINSARLGYQRGVGARVNVALGVSVIKVTPRPDAILVQVAPNLFALQPRASFNSLGYDLDVGYRASNRLTINVLASRSARANANVGSNSTITKILAFDVDYKLGPSLSSSFGYTHTENDYRYSLASVDETVARSKDKNDRVHATLAYSPVKLYTISLDVSHQNRSSTPSIYNFSSTAVALRLGVRFGRNA